MEARYVTLLMACLAMSNVAATYSSRNFVVNAPTPEMAQQIAERAEESRVEIARWWLGYELKPWFQKCKVNVQVGQMGSGGATTFAFNGGEVGDWNMNVQGSFERIMDSVIPHEVSHTIFACHFRRPLPRWADEGAATIIEHPVERDRQKQLVRQILKTNQQIPFRELLEMKEYPTDMQKVLNLYAEGYTLCEWLVFNWGQKNYLACVNAAHQEGWDQAIAAHYPFKSVEELEQGWIAWVYEGMPAPEETNPETILVQNEEAAESEQLAMNTNEGEARGQAPDVRSIGNESADRPEPQVTAKAPPARRRRTETPRESGASKAPTTGDVDLGVPGDIFAAAEALSGRGSVSSGRSRGGVESPARESDRSYSRREDDSFEKTFSGGRGTDARRSSSTREESAFSRSRIASGHQRSPASSRRIDVEEVEVGDNSLRPSPRPATRSRNVTPDEPETADRSSNKRRSASPGSAVSGSVASESSRSKRERYRRTRFKDWNTPVADAD
ncbi:MAG: hypothetical protein KDA68_21950 [Planctomycetaceae bacterium]|nr:hypothetical protein [Planctomycetaceae bacterium]